jgi:hypothetical protein
MTTYCLGLYIVHYYSMLATHLSFSLDYFFERKIYFKKIYCICHVPSSDRRSSSIFLYRITPILSLFAIRIDWYVNTGISDLQSRVHRSYSVRSEYELIWCEYLLAFTVHCLSLLVTVYCHCSVSTTSCLLSTAHCPLPSLHSPLSTAHCLLSTVHCPLFAAQWPLSTAYYPLCMLYLRSI